MLQPIVNVGGTSSDCTEFLRKIKARQCDFFRPECTVLIQLLEMLPVARVYGTLVGAGLSFRSDAGFAGRRAGRIGKCGHIFSELGTKTKINTPMQGGT